ncbi:uncharacterized protein LOC125368076 [Perognathus longimembris pacificus]|uniref:uncharacterized protein LOC125368076 n=1 Tax=Perognathus longimembris pacificus TaxID=214514 RepID=UPI0020199E1A|nr:uncharacterized protein LOC125368076 [Perognathus longimembris pacificus]
MAQWPAQPPWPLPGAGGEAGGGLPPGGGCVCESPRPRIAAGHQPSTRQRSAGPRPRGSGPARLFLPLPLSPVLPNLTPISVLLHSLTLDLPPPPLYVNTGDPNKCHLSHDQSRLGWRVGAGREGTQVIVPPCSCSWRSMMSWRNERRVEREERHPEVTQLAKAGRESYQGSEALGTNGQCSPGNEGGAVPLRSPSSSSGGGVPYLGSRGRSGALSTRHCTGHDAACAARPGVPGEARPAGGMLPKAWGQAKRHPTRLPEVQSPRKRDWGIWERNGETQALEKDTSKKMWGARSLWLTPAILAT